MKLEIDAVRDWLGQGSINIFGMPYAGKDTQGQALADLMGAELLGGGEILRNSVIPHNVREIMHRGDLIPTEDYLKIVLPYLSDSRFDNKPLLLSSVGRWHGEEEGVLRAAQESNHPIRAVVYLSVPVSVARQRHATMDIDDRTHRADDAAEVFDNRISEFNEKTLPVIDYYRQRGLVIDIDGTRLAPQVTSDILSALAKLATSSTSRAST